MGASHQRQFAMRGAGRGVHDDGSSLSFKYVPKSLAQLTAETDAALNEVAELLGWSNDRCLSAAGRTGWPEGFVDIDVLAAIIRFESALAEEGNAKRLNDVA
jgi:hypothetical protein